MKIKELVQPYRNLALLRAREQGKTEHQNALTVNSFDWEKTPEGREFWQMVYIGEDPVMPTSSFKEAVSMAEEKSEIALGAEVKAPEYTGGSSSYYSVEIKRPTTSGRAPYIAECNDIIEALGMDFAEGNAFKAIWRIAAARQGKQKKGHNEKYDWEKINFFAERKLINLNQDNE
jgi:hypothetical protein